MKGKTSVTLSSVLRQYLKDRAKAAVQKRDSELITASLEELNAEAEDALGYQVPED